MNEKLTGHPMPGFESFDASSVPLEGSNLIEASAGTGKTYSIAILVLRLVLEKQLSVKEILMVTFTKAAVAELEERVRLFITQAYKASRGGQIKDQLIKALVDRATDESGAEDVQAMLREAVLFLDETSVLTIHSFCQLTLTEFAFETRQLFGAETLQDTSALLADEVNKFWRKHVTTIPTELLNLLMAEGLSRANIAAVIKEHLDGKRYYEYNGSEDYSFCEEDHLNYMKEVRELKDKEQELRNCLIDHISDNREDLRQITEGNTTARKNLLPLIDDAEQFLNAVIKKRSSAYVMKLYSDLLDRCDECDGVVEQYKRILRKVISRIHCLAINHISTGVLEHKRRNNQMSFDDMIVNLHAALVKRDNPRLVEGLQQKYRAVFVDEFQDTDRLQYEIFNRAFGSGTVLFYIGDPKQSIYAWRKADIHTYFKAYDAVEHRYGMNQNFRSSEAFIEAMNIFFEPQLGFDTFFFENATHAIEYIKVDSPAGNKKGQLWKDNEAEPPISISVLPNKEAIYEAVAAQVIALLENNEYSIMKEGEHAGIGPADIGILVRSNFDGKKIKEKLSKYRIPAVTIADDKVLQSEEAAFLLYVLEAMAGPSLQNINRALLSPFTGYTSGDILSLDDETALQLFSGYKSTWEEHGVYAPLMAFVNDYAVKEVLLDQRSENGERAITNLFQLIEILHKVQTRKKLSPAELISWLKRGIEGMETEGDEFEQRVESDEESVKIVTIHKSKGLEYKIVLAPFLDLTVDTSRPYCSFRDAETGEYVSAARESLSDEQKSLLSRQQEQENRRLLYVAITRAVYKCFIYKNTYYKQSSLSVFVDALADLSSPLIEFSTPMVIPENYRYTTSRTAPAVALQRDVKFALKEKNWRKMSYSMLSPEHSPAMLRRAEKKADAYENFVFTELTRGAKTGNLLHYIFENVHFDNDKRWEHVIEAAVKRFAPQSSELYEPMLHVLLDHVLHVKVKDGDKEFCMADVPHEKQLHELEFDFRVPLFQTSQLESLSDEQTTVHVDNLSKLEGLMNGKMDLFFEWGGRYYILDWKSNYLGDSLNDYSPAGLAATMNENNYHLQYLIYTVAAKKYLQSRLPSFSYEKHLAA